MINKMGEIQTSKEEGKTQIDVVTGFLGSGKTDFIYRLLSKDLLKKDRTHIIILCEKGLKNFDQKALEKSNIFIYAIEDPADLNTRLFDYIKEKYTPDHILIEYNALWDIKEFLKIELPKNYYIGCILAVIDADQFRIDKIKKRSLLIRQIRKSDLVILNHLDRLSVENRLSIKKDLKEMNMKIKIFEDTEFRVEEKVKRLIMSYSKKWLIHL